MKFRNRIFRAGRIPDLNFARDLKIMEPQYLKLMRQMPLSGSLV